MFEANSLELRLVAAERDRALGLAKQARARPNPVAGFSHEGLSESGRDYSESYFTLSQRLEWPGRHGARAETSDEEAAALESRLDAQRLRLAFEVKRVFIEAAAAEERVAHRQGRSLCVPDGGAKRSRAFPRGGPIRLRCATTSYRASALRKPERVGRNRSQERASSARVLDSPRIARDRPGGGARGRTSARRGARGENGDCTRSRAPGGNAKRSFADGRGQRFH